MNKHEVNMEKELLTAFQKRNEVFMKTVEPILREWTIDINVLIAKLGPEVSHPIFLEAIAVEGTNDFMLKFCTLMSVISQALVLRDEAQKAHYAADDLEGLTVRKAEG
jgi:hypothetical protein